jgi:hypothetical protein
MAIQTVYQKRKTVTKQVFISVFVVSVIICFLVLSYLGFSFMENILISCVVFLAAFGMALASTASVSNKAAVPQMTTKEGAYAAPTAFSHNSGLYGVKGKAKFITELNTCRRCGQTMLSGINTCPKCGWYTPH